MEIGTRIRQLRTENGLKQKELAEKIHVAANTLSQFETGKANPGYDVLIALADFFEVSADYLLGRADETGNVKILPDRTGVYPSFDEAELLSLYRRADETGKARIKAYAEGCAAAKDKNYFKFGRI